MNICIFGASSELIDKSYLDSAEELGRKLALKGHSLVYGGGAQGVMGASARGVKSAGGRVIGVSPSFFNVDGVLFEECDELIYTETMRERKAVMEDNADAFIIAPGGIGTYEEFFEIFTSKQLARHSKAIVIFNHNGYYNKLIEAMKDAEEKKFIRYPTLELYEVMEDIDEIIEYLENYVPQKVDIIKTRGLE